jgi:kynureninase
MGRFLTRSEVLAMDRVDALSKLRSEFLLPEGVIYLDGNSLGALPKATAERIGEVIHNAWGRDLIRSWNTHRWIDLPLQLGAAIAPLIGADSDEVMVGDSTSVNLFKLLAAALRLRPGRFTILTETANFPTDVHMAQGLADLLGGRVETRIVARHDLGAALDDTVAVLMLTHVDFRTGELHDMATLTAMAHQRGALALWDLCHSVGAVSVDLRACDVDLAVGCGYKYLNGGPGAPAFAFVARELHGELNQPLWGWFGHESPFQFALDYRPAPGIARLQCGTPPILSIVALATGVEIISRAGIDQLRKKSVALSELFIRLMEQECSGFGFELASPPEPERRGSHVSYRHKHGYAIAQALIAREVIPDFRGPDLLRFGFAPAYSSFVDIWDAVACLKDIMAEREWDRDEYHRRARVT